MTASALTSVPTPPVRSPRTSIILAELARQRRWERQQRRKARARRATWLAGLFNCRAFESVRMQNPPAITFAATTPFVYAVAWAW